MKKILLVACICLIMLLYPCKKTDNNLITGTPPANVLGRWNVLVDSTSAGAGQEDYFKSYNGQPGDYYNFSANGVLYIKEETVADTLNYQLISDTQIGIKGFSTISESSFQTCSVTNFTKQS